LCAEVFELSRPFLLRYGCAAVSIVIATWVRVALNPILGDQARFPTFFFAVLVTAWYGGARPACVAGILGGLSADYFLLPPRASFGLQGLTQYVELGLYATVSAGIAVLGAAMSAAPLGDTRKLRQTREETGADR